MQERKNSLNKSTSNPQIHPLILTPNSNSNLHSRNQQLRPNKSDNAPTQPPLHQINPQHIQQHQRELVFMPTPDTLHIDTTQNNISQLSTSKISTRSLSNKEKIRKLFLMYCEISNEKGEFLMKSQKYHKLMIDSHVIDESRICQSKVEVIFFSLATRKGLSFDKFLGSLVKIGEFRYYDTFRQNPNVAVKKIIDQHLLVHYDYLSSKNSSMKGGQSELLEEISFDEEVKMIMNSIYSSLFEIYEVYFHAPLKKAKTTKHYTQLLSGYVIDFLRDFDLCPSIISKQNSLLLIDFLMGMENEELTSTLQTESVFYELRNKKGELINQDKGTNFTLSRFFVFLLWMSVVGFDSIREDYMCFSSSEKLYYTLTKMELSKGFHNIQRRTLKPYTPTSTLIPPPNIIEEIIKNNPIEKKEPLKPELINTHEESLQVREDIQKETMALELYLDKLQRLYTWYCSSGDNLSSNKMSCSKLIKILKDCQIINTNIKNCKTPSEATFHPSATQKEFPGYLRTSEIEIIFSKVISIKNDKNLEMESEEFSSPMRNPKFSNFFLEKNKQGKLDFNGFVYALSMISSRIYPQLSSQKALLTLIEKKLLKLCETNMSLDQGSLLIQEMIKILKDSEIVELLTFLHQVLEGYYESYCNSHKYINFDNFMKFCKDFAVFPDLCSQTMLNRTFYALSYILSRAQYQSICSFLILTGEVTSPKEPFTFSVIENQKKSEKLDIHLFIEALAMCALQSRSFEQEKEPLEKIIRLIEKMMQSGGIAKVRKKVGTIKIQKNRKYPKTISKVETDPFLMLKKKYPEYFQSQKLQSPENIVDDILDDEENEIY